MKKTAILSAIRESSDDELKARVKRLEEELFQHLRPVPVGHQRRAGGVEGGAQDGCLRKARASAISGGDPGRSFHQVTRRR